MPTHPAEAHPTMTVVDGNAVAGMLAPAMPGDATMLAITCAFCHDHFVLAETVVEREPMSAVVRCRSCTHTLFTLQDEPDALVLRVGGMDFRFAR
jgi:hypothetical protein